MQHLLTGPRYCLTSAATVFIHTLYYTDHDSYVNQQRLLELFESLNDMRSMWKCVDSQVRNAIAYSSVTIL